MSTSVYYIPFHHLYSTLLVHQKTAAMEQYKYAIEELMADETAVENKRLEIELKESKFEKQKVINQNL